jgi:fructokinase
VGEDPEGQLILDAMAGWGMDLDDVQTDPEHPTGQVRVSIADGEPTYECLTDRAYDHIRQVHGGLRCDLLYHGTLALRGADSAQALDALKAGAPKLVFMDVNLRTPWWSAEQTLARVDGADWVKLSQAEFGILTGAVNGSSDQDLEARAASFRAAHGLDGLVLTLGAAGSLAVAVNEPPVRIAPTTAPNLVDTVGAGDAFAAVLILGLLHQWPLETSLGRAQQFASRIVEQAGATATDPGLYEPFIDQWGLAPADRPSQTPSLAQPISAPKRRGRPRRA